MTIDLAPTQRMADDVWDIWLQLRTQMVTAQNGGNDFEYQTNYNSNTFATTLLYSVHLDTTDFLTGVTPPDVDDGFPGVNRNAMIDYKYKNDAIDLTLNGKDNVDLIQTGNGADTLVGNGGKDILVGGNGNDILYGAKNTAAPADWDDNTVDKLAGGKGMDTYFIGARNPGLPNTTHSVFVPGTQNGQINQAIYDNIDLISDIDGLGIINLGIDEFHNGSYANYVFDGSFGWADRNVLFGLQQWGGGFGFAVLDTSNGNNRLIFFDVEYFNAWFAIDDFRNGDFGITLPNYTGATGPRSCDFCPDGETVGTSGNDTIDGTSKSEIIEGGAGNDVINGNGGDDTIIGGNSSGNDTYNGGAGRDTIVYDSATSALTINLAAGTASGANIGFDTLNSIEDVVAGGGNDTITGSSVANYILSGDGIDTILGLAGDDTLDGGANNDTLFGGDGNDTIIGGIGDNIQGQNGNDIIIVDNQLLLGLGGGAGFDTIIWDTAISIGMNIPDQSFERIFGGFSADGLSAVGAIGSVELNGRSGGDLLIGGDFNDTINGDEGNDQLVGQVTGVSAGIDTMNGGAGSDSFTFDANDIIDGGAGIDNAIFAENVALNFNLAARNIENIYGNGQGDFLDGSGMTVATQLRGLGGNDIMTGGTASDLLEGGTGNDRLTGGGAGDLIRGGTGTDTAVYTGNQSNYTVAFQGGTTWAIIDNVGGEGIDILENVEFAEFADGTIGL